MRLDLFLKFSRLIPRRSLAQEVCEHGAVRVNGATAKSSRQVRPGDLIEWRQRHTVITLRVARTPSTQPGKKDAAALYEPVRTDHAERLPE
jgi:ribosomal 50S subunit-recycling heat shock protein